MKEKGRGVILNIVTESGKGVAYLSSVAGLAALSASAESELSQYGIQVHAVENSINMVETVMRILEAE
jgi:NAD(P)-dependent dehydrogenase (short-subunit alcohol dehydrogenase family)